MNTESLVGIFEKALNLYNNLFFVIIIIIIIAVLIKGFAIFSDNNENKKITFRVTLHSGFEKLIEQIIVFIVLCFIINMCIEINVINLLLEYGLIKIIIGGIAVYDLCYSYKVYGRLRFDDFLDDIEDGKYMYSPTQSEYENLIIDYKTSIELIKEKLGIIKSLTPISVITVIAGYVLEGEDIVINWNGCTIVFVIFIILCIWAIYDNFKKLCNIKLKLAEVEKRLNKNKYDDHIPKKS